MIRHYIYIYIIPNTININVKCPAPRKAIEKANLCLCLNSVKNFVTKIFLGKANTRTKTQNLIIAITVYWWILEVARDITRMINKEKATKPSTIVRLLYKTYM